jgi:hypothetical protein
MICLNNPFMKLAVICDGISYPVEAICTSVGEANVLCGLNPSLSVMGEDGSNRYYLVRSAMPTPKHPHGKPTQKQLEQLVNTAEIRAGTQ